MSYSVECPESPDSPPSSDLIRRQEDYAQQRLQDYEDMVEKAARVQVQGGERYRKAVALKRNNFLANWIDGNLHGSKRACQMVIMSFNSDNKDYFNQWNTKKLMSEEEFNKVTSPVLFFS